ncbi:MAG: Cof-type HAD-IIB family hydrolase [Lachnospiraceae bacterium]
MGALLFFDIDGTLITLDSIHEFPESTKKALLEAKKNGHKIFINTGRVKTAIDRKLLEFPFDGFVCGCGTYIEYEGKTLFHTQIEKGLCETYAKQIHEWNLGTVYEGKNQLFIDGDHGPGSFLEFIYDYFGHNSNMPIEDYTHPALIYDKFTTSKLPGSDMDSFMECFGKEFHLIPHGEAVVEAVPLGCSKATGIEFLQKHLKADKEECYAFGDSINDMEMLQYVPHPVSMGNGVNEVKEVAEYITSDVDDDGIANALKYYGLI